MSEKKSGKWIWPHIERTVNQYADFLDCFYLDALPAQAQIKISADSQYCLWLNGKQLSCGQYADYPFYKVYDQIDLAPALKTGENILAITGYCQLEASSVYFPGEAGVWFEVWADDILIAASGNHTLSRQNPCYQSGEVIKISGQLSYSFLFDGRKQDGWLTGDANGFLPSAESETAPPSVPRPIHKLTLSDCIGGDVVAQGLFLSDCSDKEIGRRMARAFHSFRRPEELSDTRNRLKIGGDPVDLRGEAGYGLYLILDLKQMRAGHLHLDFELEEEAAVDIGFGEHLTDGRVRTYIPPRNFASSYQGRKGRQQFTHFYKRFGCRYLQLHFHTDRVRIYRAGVLESSYPLKEKQPPVLHGILEEQIYQTAVRTLKLCMHEHYEDTPWREQALYAADSRLQMLCGYYAFEEFDFARASLVLLSKGLREDGLLELCAPALVSVTIPCFSLHYILALCEYEAHSGDIGLLSELEPVVDRIFAAFLDKQGENDLIRCFSGAPYWNFYEWTQGLDGGGNSTAEQYDLPLNALFSWAAREWGTACRKRGLSKQAQRYLDLHQNMNKKIEEVFFDPDSGQYYTYSDANGVRLFSELAASLAVCCGAYSSENLEQILDRLWESKEDTVGLSLTNQFFRYEALMKKPANAPRVREDIARRFSRMLFAGATSFWETETGGDDFDFAGSLSHGWSAIPVYFYGKYQL